MNDRRNSEPRDVLSFGPFSLFPAERLLKKADKPIAIGGRALDILIELMERAGEVVTNKELISAVWPDVVVEKGNLRFQMATLRRLVTDETALAMCRMLLVVGIVSSLRSHARRPLERFKSPGPPQRNEFKGCRHDQREWSVAMTLFESWRGNYRCGASSASSVLEASGKPP